MELAQATGLKNDQGEDIYVTDQMVDQLLDDQSVGENLRKADLRRNSLSKEEWHKLRVLCKRDLFFLCYSVLGNKRLSTNLHGHLCTHVRKTENDRFHEYLMPRGHFKSTILTIGHSIQVVLPYTDEDRQYDLDTSPLPWPNSLGTDCRVLIGHETHESAARFLFAITNHFTGNPLLMALFPDAIPSKRKHRINKWELELPRSDAARGNPEPTIDTLGVGGKSQGRHYNYIKLDDIFGDKARDSAAEAETTIQWFDNIQSFFSTFKEDHLDLTGTRYSHDDVYEHAEEVYGEQLIKYHRKVEEVVKDEKTGLAILGPDKKPLKQPIFPEEFTPEALAIIRKNKKVFNAQYLNDPDDGTSGFNPEWKRYFYWTGVNQIAVFDGESRTTVNVRDLDICILIDPGEQSGGFAVTGMDYYGRVFVLVAIRIELKPPDLTDLVFRMAVRWQPRIVAIESDMFAAVYQYWWQAEMKTRSIRFNIEPVFTKQRSKDDRIMGLSQYMSAQKFFINEAQDELAQEWKRVGKSRNVHIFDAIAYGPEVWRHGYLPGQRDIIETVVGDQDQSGRDPETGYSVI